MIIREKERHNKGFILERDDGRSSADVSRHRVQDLHGVLQLQLLIQRHDTGLGPVVSDQDLPQDSIVELHKPGTERRGNTLLSLCETEVSEIKTNYAFVMKEQVGFGQL